MRLSDSFALRLLLLGGGLLAFLFALQAAVGRLIVRLSAPVRSPVLLIAELLVGALMIAGYRAGVRWLERRDAAELAAGPSAALVAPGMLIGASLFAAVYAILWAMGVIAYGGYAGSAGLMAAVGTSAAAAIGEEVIFRGALFRIVDERFGTLAALVCSAALFGLLHAANHGATWLSTAAIALEAGVLLGAAYAAARSLWLPIGVHFGWNFTEGGIVGAAVSGGRSHGLLATTLRGPAVLTGGAFGPEASVVAVAVCLSAAAVFIAVILKRGQWRPARLTRRVPRPPDPRVRFRRS